MTSYSNTIKELFDLQKFAIKLGLDNITSLCGFLENPHEAYPAIHIAGTNGKGSTAFYIARILQSMGLRVGLFTSPHLFDFRERIRVNNKLVSREFIADFWERTKSLVLQRKATFFDTTTALAFDYFRYKNVDVAVIETGLGGRLDSTNILKPKLAVLTPVNYDHQKQLGDSLRSIATEKAGIIKKDSVVFSAGQETQTLAVFREYLPDPGEFYYLPKLVSTEIRKRSLKSIQFDMIDKQNDSVFENLTTRQVGDFQVDNLALSYLVSRHYLTMNGISFDEIKFRGILEAEVWPGRMQLIQENPPVILDVSHNLHGIRNTLKYLSKVVNKQKPVVLVGLVQDKDYASIASEIGRFASRVIITEPATHRKLAGGELLEAFEAKKINAHLIKEVKEAYEFSVSSLTNDEILLVIGSHYLIGALVNSIN